MKLIVFQSAWSYKTLCDRNLQVFATSKDLGGFFEKVYTVHPASTIEDEVASKSRYGKLAIYDHSATHTFIEAKAGRFWKLRSFPFINFIFSQINLIYFLLKLTRGEKEIFIRAEDPRYNGLLAFFFIHLKRRPLILGCWGNPHTIRNYTRRPIQPRVFKTTKIEEFFERFLLKRADRVLVQNEDNLNYAVLFGAKKENIRYFRLGNAIFPGHFEELKQRTVLPSDIDAIGQNGFKICTISRLEKVKVVDHALRAFHAMKNCSESQLYLFGDGSEGDSLKYLAHNLGIENRVHFMGNVDQEMLARLLPLMDLVLSPLMGRALTEAALAERPIVAYDIDCHPEIVKNDQSGFLVPYLDYRAMALAGDHLLDNPAVAKKMGLEARAVALDLMDPVKLIREQRLVFRELLANGN